jgi:hypothetical protein
MTSFRADRCHTFGPLMNGPHFGKRTGDSILPDDSQKSFNHDLLANIPTLFEVDSVVLWLGVGVAEQLFLAWIVQLLKLIRSRARLHIVQFTRVGERNTDVWALKLLIQRYPDHQTGLGRWEYELLRNTKEYGPRAVRVIGHTMGLNFDADLVGDAYLFAQLRSLANSDLAYPLITLSGDPNSMRNCEISLTEAGESVLAGQANAEISAYSTAMPRRSHTKRPARVR